MRFAPLFQDHAVLQRDLPLPVWGTGAPHETVTVTLAGSTAHALANGDGHWLARLPPLPAGGPHDLAAEAASGRAVVRDILLGEVWVCSGQSNMEWKLSQVVPPDVEGLPSDLPEIRLLTVTNPARYGAAQGVDGRWAAASEATLAAFSAIGGAFGREVHRALGVPVGLICTAWGGTRIQAWIRREALAQDPLGSEELREFEATAHLPAAPGSAAYSSFADWERRGAPQDRGNRGLAEGWAAPGFDDSAWPAMPVPSRWQDHGHPENGVFWFRRSVAVPPAWAGRDLELHLGEIDKHDDTWVNGERVGGLSWEAGERAWCTPRVYPVPARLVGPEGRVEIAVRARSHVYHGGMTGPASLMRLAPAGADGAENPLPLAGSWRYQVEQDWGVAQPPEAKWGLDTPNSPSILFDSRIAPLVPFALRGILWYQGESNAEQAAHYRRLLPLLIRDWRRAWGQGDFAFLQVQLANFRRAVEEPGRSEWAELRDAQAAALEEPGVGMAVALDLGDPLDIHPRNKHEVGLRLARWALAETYGRGGVPSGPLYAGTVAEAEGRLRLRFRHAAGLGTRDGAAPRHVAVAGADRAFVWAESRVEGESLVVWHPAIPRPAAVRYAWADNPEAANLRNAAGLPAAPFRTDSW